MSDFDRGVWWRLDEGRSALGCVLFWVGRRRVGFGFVSFWYACAPADLKWVDLWGVLDEGRMRF